MAAQLPSAVAARTLNAPFGGVLLASDAVRTRRLGALMAGIGTVQVVLSASAYLRAVTSPEPVDHPDLLAVLIYDPPPPPPPPLPKGSPLHAQLARPDPPQLVVDQPSAPAFTVPIPEPLDDVALAPERGVESQFGSATGSDLGDPLGLEDGVPGGVVGGTPGGVPGGVIGGHGNGAVPDYDVGARPVKQTKPQYPQEAFVKRIEGTVLLEILIDASGNVTPTRVLQSIPLLDDAARATVRQWLFRPAMRHGRPVASLAYAPVQFRIY